jgi:hypothetical protein
VENRNVAISVDGIHDLAYWARSKACNGWRDDQVCRDNETNEPLDSPHPGCVHAQRAHDLLASLQRYEGEEVVGWLVTDAAVDSDLWQ